MSPLSLWCLLAVFTLYFCGLYLHIYACISSVFLPNKMKNKWWVHLNDQSLLDCICIVCMFVFLLSTIYLHLCVNYFSMCLLKVFLNEKWIIVFLNFFIHHHRWWSLVHWGPLSICWVSFLVPQNILNWHLCLWQGHCLSTFSWQALLHCIFFKPPEICIFQNNFRDVFHLFFQNKDDICAI